MGVPKFFRFISERYPLLSAPVSPARPAPRVDRLYLDMNGVVHTCARPAAPDARYASSAPRPRPQHDIFLDVFKYVDNLVALARPTRLVYLAVDGVAPRAKMNQQRARRFRAAKERDEEHRRRMDEDPMYAAAAQEPFDSNCITPGTEFMQSLTEALRYFVARKISEDQAWASLEVVLSGPEAPGEGEHKIMEHIRAHREAGSLPPNTVHCVYGLDADLIMLGLVTHEPHFFILREKVDFGAAWRRKGGPRTASALDTTVFGQFELLSIGLLREYLVRELGADGNAALPFFNVERVTDDFVFILMLIGNDFLPNLPTLDIADGTLSVMLHLYKRLLPLFGGFLTQEGRIFPARLEFFLAKLGMLEKTILRAKLEGQSGGRRRRGGGNSRAVTVQEAHLDELFDLTPPGAGRPLGALSSPQLRERAAVVRARINDAEMREMKTNYYSQKFGRSFNTDGSPGLQELTQSYVEGVWWTLRYYTEGCRHWRWFYPFHYAPLASDVIDVNFKLEDYKARFIRDTPFQPHEQLLSVLPPISAWCLPKPFRSLMMSPTSPIRDQYPDDFSTDLNGKQNEWEAVVLLPFVDEDRLMQAIQSVQLDELTDEEKMRNRHGPSFSYKFSPNCSESVDSPFGPQLSSFISRARKSELALPRVPDGQAFTARLVSGTLPPRSNASLGDLPFLGALQHKCELISAGVNVFGSPSKNQSLILRMDFAVDKDEGATSGAGGKSSLLSKKGISAGDPIWYGYPWRTAGVVQSISSKSQGRRMSHAEQKAQSLGAKNGDGKEANRSTFNTDVSILASELLLKGGILVEPPTEFAVVRPLEDPVPTSSREGDSESTLTFVDPHFIERRAASAAPKAAAKNRNVYLRKGQSVLYVGGGVYFGHVGVVRGVVNEDVVRVEFECAGAAAREPAFGYRVVNISTNNQRWLTLSKLASEVGISVPMADSFLGSIRVRLQFGKEEIDLGLGIKYIARGLYIPGFARPDQRQYYSFSDKTVDLLKRYRAAFPHLFETIKAQKRGEFEGSNGKARGNTVYTSKDLFGNTKKADEAARAASTWISVQEVARLPLVSANSEVLTKDTVQELQRHAGIVRALQDEFGRTLGHVSAAKRTLDVTRQSVLTGAEAMDWTPRSDRGGYGANFPVPADGSGLRVGDRVVSRMGTGSVPFGKRGTVVGIHVHRGSDSQGGRKGAPGEGVRALIEVVFDDDFISGSTLNGRCSPGRGKAVPAQSLFIVRPDRDNTYYVKNYARVAAWSGASGKPVAAEERKLKEQSDAIARASVLTYAGALRKPAAKGEQGGKAAAPVAPVQARLLSQASGTPVLLPSSIQRGEAPARVPAYNGGVIGSKDIGAGGLLASEPLGGGMQFAARSPKTDRSSSLPLPSFITSGAEKVDIGPGGLEDGQVSVERVGRSGEPVGSAAREAGKSNAVDTVEVEAERLAEMLKQDLGIAGESVMDMEQSDMGMTAGQDSERVVPGGERDSGHGLEGGQDDFVSLWEQLQQEAQERSS